MASALGTVEHVTASATAQVDGVADTAAGVAATADTTVRRTAAGVTGTADAVVRRTADGVSRAAQPTVEAARGAPKPEPVESAAGAVGVGAPAEPSATAEPSSPVAPPGERSAARSDRTARRTREAPARGTGTRSRRADGAHHARVEAPTTLARTNVEIVPSRAVIGPATTAGPRPSAGALQRRSPAPDREPPTGGGSSLSGIPASLYFGGLALLASALAFAGPRLRRRLELQPARCLAPAFVALPERPG